MFVLAVNSGSTSAKLAAFASADGGATLARVRTAHLSGEGLDPHAELKRFLAALDGTVDAAAHRVVHGGTHFVRPTLIDRAVEESLHALCELAPLHNPIALRWIGAARAACHSGASQIAVFDTAFFAGLPRVASEYALPPELGTRIGVRRYGFHGLAHEAMWHRWCELHPELPKGGRLITLQLGGGCSITAIDAGQPLDTTMGFSPLEGLVMATRSGDLDPAAVAYLAHRLRESPARVIERLNHESGLVGVSGRSGDLRDLLRAQDEAGQFALELYCYRARKYVGAYLAVLGGCDGIVFGGGVGEHMPEIREQILAPLGWMGIAIDHPANQAARGVESCISPAGSAVAVQVIPVDEERTLARAAFALAGAAHGT